MESLKELIQVVTKHKTKALKTLDTSTGDRAHEFYLKIASGKLSTDKEAAKYFFNSTPKNAQYRKLKNKLTELLLNTAVFMDTNSAKFNDAQKAFYTCHKNLVLVRILRGRSAGKPAIDLIKKTLKYSMRYEFNDINVELWGLLRQHHATKTGDRRRYLECDQQAQRAAVTLTAENLALHWLEKLSLERVASTSRADSYSEIAREAIQVLEEFKEIDSYRFLLFKGNLETNYLMYSGRYEGLVSKCDEALVRFKKKKYANKEVVGQFLFMKLIGYSQIGTFEQCRKSYVVCERMFENGTVRWYNSNDVYFRVLLVHRRYSGALKVFEKMSTHATAKYQAQKRQEDFKIYQATLFYLSLQNKVKDKKLERFRLRKFLNEIPMYSQDKRGYNIPVLIIQILILIQMQKYDQLTDRIEAIEKYTSRYLRNDENFRSNCFIKMLLQVPKRNFHKVAVLRHAKPYVDKLATMPRSKSKQFFEVEIIPYEHLWEFVLESLEDRNVLSRVHS